MEIDILCVGHASYDLSVFVEDFPVENSKCETSELLESGGGPAANAAYLASLWGARAGFAGVVGDDLYGRRVCEEFALAATNLSLIERRTGHSTPVSMILINKRNGSRTIVNRKCPGAPLVLDRHSLAAMRPRVLLFDGHELEASLAAGEAFPEAISILDAGSWRPGTAELAGRVDYLAASERFALQATGLSNLCAEPERRECVRMLRQRYANQVVVTLGENGLIADVGGGFFSLPAYPAVVVDTTAAGDIFHGAFAFALARRPVGSPCGRDESGAFQDNLRFAAMAASLSVRAPGGRRSIPPLAKVEEALAHGG